MRIIRVIDGRLRGKAGGAFLVEGQYDVYFPDHDVDTIAGWWLAQPIGPTTQIVTERMSGNGVYYTPPGIIEPATGTGNYLQRAAQDLVSGNPPYSAG